MKELTFLVRKWQWQDRAPWKEGRMQDTEEFIKAGNIEEGYPTTRVDISSIVKLDKQKKDITTSGFAEYIFSGKIVAGYYKFIVVDCGFLIRVAVRDEHLKQKVLLKYGDWIKFKGTLELEWCDSFQSAIFFEKRCSGEIKKVQKMSNGDLLLTMKMIISADKIKIIVMETPSVKREPDKKWQYIFGEKDD